VVLLAATAGNPDVLLFLYEYVRCHLRIVHTAGGRSRATNSQHECGASATVAGEFKIDRSTSIPTSGLARHNFNSDFRPGEAHSATYFQPRTPTRVAAAITSLTLCIMIVQVCTPSSNVHTTLYTIALIESIIKGTKRTLNM
jgi:hypothetical protein